MGYIFAIFWSCSRWRFYYIKDLISKRFILKMQKDQKFPNQTHIEKQQRSQKCVTIMRQRQEQYQTNNQGNHLLCAMKLYYQHQIYNKLGCSYFNKHSVMSSQDKDRLKFKHIFQEVKDKKSFQPLLNQLQDKTISRGVAAILGMAIGDALGACTEFMKFRKQGYGIIKNSFCDIHSAIIDKKLQSRHGKVGVWTDDASMGLCMADSILLNKYEFNPKNMRHTFIVWLHHGLNNGGRYRSIGLGGNISISMDQFLDKQADYTEEGDRFNNGNGSLMRLAPVPIAYSSHPQKGILYSGLQSLTTHNGLEALQCCRLMGTILIELVNRKEEVDGKKLLIEICDKFETNNRSVECLAKGLMQPQEHFNVLAQNKKFRKFNKSTEDRNWNWRENTHTYSPCRFKQQPGYIGSYCMDALAMALHTVYFSESFLQVVAKNADMGGDCDTVGSIAGQIAGAIYGVDESMLNLYSEMDDYTNKRYEVFLKAYKLAAKRQID